MGRYKLKMSENSEMSRLFTFKVHFIQNIYCIILTKYFNQLVTYNVDIFVAINQIAKINNPDS